MWTVSVITLALHLITNASGFSPHVDLYAKPAVSVAILEPDYDNAFVLDTDVPSLLNERTEIVQIHNHSHLCTLPDMGNELEPLSPDEKAKAVQEHSVDYLLRLLNGLEGKCIFIMTQGYWTYRLCYNSHVQQYHAQHPEGRPEPGGPVFVLGNMVDARTSTRLNLPDDIHFGSIVQSYTNGTVCDLTNKPRTIDVHYRCVPSEVKDYFRIISIKEAKTCHYELIVATSALCDDSLLGLKEDVNEVLCKRIMSREEAAALLVEKKQDSVSKDGVFVAERYINEAYITSEAFNGTGGAKAILQEEADDLNNQDLLRSVINQLTDQINRGTLVVDGYTITVNDRFDTLMSVYSDDDGERHGSFHVKYDNGVLEVELYDQDSSSSISSESVTDTTSIFIHDEL